MCGRLEGRDFYDYPGIAIVMTIFFLLSVPFVSAAQSVQISVSEIAEQMAEEGASEAEVESFLEALSSLSGRPLDINSADRNSLEAISLLSVFQIESLLAYREQFGAIRSVTELGFVDGFGGGAAKRLAPLFSFDGETVASQNDLSVGDVRIRLKQKNTNAGFYNSIRAGLSVGRFGFNISMESDAGERPADFLSGYVSCRFKNSELLLGDFKARFGQGLVCWKSFSMVALGNPSASLKKSPGITPYRGFDEDNFFRGIAFSHHPSKRLEYSVFASANKLDASVTDSTYTSIITGGYHRSESEIAKKNRLWEFVVGGRASFTGQHLKVGVTAAGYSYNKRNARKVLPYNEFQQYDGLWGNVSVDVIYSVNHLRLFTEVALDAHGAVAALGGALWSPSYNFEGMMMLRHYPKNYIATHAGAYSSQSAVTNQEGFLLNVLWRPFDRWTFSAFNDIVYYPYLRYRVKVPSLQCKTKLKAEYTDDIINCYLQESYTYQSSTCQHKHSVRAKFGLLSVGNFSFSVRGDVSLLHSPFSEVEKGFAAAFEGTFSAFNGKFGASAYFAWYDTDSYDSRVYLGEKDLPASFSSVARYGNGCSYYVIVACKKMKIGRLDVNAALKAGCNKPVASATCLEIKGQIEIDF